MFKTSNYKQFINNHERYHKLPLCASMGEVSTVAKFAQRARGLGPKRTFLGTTSGEEGFRPLTASSISYYVSLYGEAVN
jgi:hypothetical protein